MLTFEVLSNTSNRKLSQLSRCNSSGALRKEVLITNLLIALERGEFAHCLTSQKSHSSLRPKQAWSYRCEDDEDYEIEEEEEEEREEEFDFQHIELQIRDEDDMDMDQEAEESDFYQGYSTRRPSSSKGPSSRMEADDNDDHDDDNDSEDSEFEKHWLMKKLPPQPPKIKAKTLAKSKSCQTSSAKSSSSSPSSSKSSKKKSSENSKKKSKKTKKAKITHDEYSSGLQQSLSDSESDFSFESDASLSEVGELEEPEKLDEEAAVVQNEQAPLNPHSEQLALETIDWEQNETTKALNIALHSFTEQSENLEELFDLENQRYSVETISEIENPEKLNELCQNEKEMAKLSNIPLSIPLASTQDGLDGPSQLGLKSEIDFNTISKLGSLSEMNRLLNSDYELVDEESKKRKRMIDQPENELEDGDINESDYGDWEFSNFEESPSKKRKTQPISTVPL